ncbi:alpha/beta hydrolase family protein [Brevibacillus massiliensis]|uniref:alpha/beta hydrolase family protein n=1 Tax=Brevibacillus massiliensis TaxID=1118054 RepID=UPI0002D8130D|nr:alpha/beta fold hydrolase [Brevibacillus massiliensis]
MESPIAIENRQGQKMIGVLHLPDASAAGPAVVFAHGFLGVKSAPHRLFVKMARALTRQGIACLRFDYIGSGDSEGDFSEVTITGEVNDLIDAISHMAVLKEYRVQELGLIGYSLGGCVASLAAPAAPIPVTGLVLWAPVSDPLDNFTHLLGEERITRGLRGEFVEFQGEIISSAFIRELPSLRPVDGISRFPAPVLVIHGEDDRDVLFANGLSYGRAFRHPKSRLLPHPAAGHLFDSFHSESLLIRQTLDWLSEIFKSR